MTTNPTRRMVKPMKPLGKDSGATIVEFALVMPLLAVMLFAIIQYGLIFSAYSTLRHGAQVASRSLSLAGATTNSVDSVACEAIKPLLDCNRLQPAQVTPITVNGTAGIQVRLSYTMPLIIRFVVPNASGNTLTLNAVAIDRKY